jgi:hypothetical protein
MEAEIAVARAYEIVENPQKDDQSKIDDLLWIDAQIYQNIGIETSKNYKEKSKRASAVIYRLIKTIDHEKGQRFLNALGLSK